MDSDTKNNVISFIDRKNKEPVSKEPLVLSELDEILLKNKRNEERMRKDRIKSNLSVLRSYRIKKN